MRCYDVDVERRNLREELTEGRFLLATGELRAARGIANGPASRGGHDRVAARSAR